MKKKLICTIAGAVLLSPTIGTISEGTNVVSQNTAQAKQKYPSAPGSSTKPFQPHYKKVGTTTKTITVGKQRQKEAIKSLAGTAASMIAGYGGAVKAARVISAFGGAGTIRTALFGGSNKTKFPIKLVTTKYKQTNKKIQNRNAGYVIVKAYNKNTGKHLQTKKIFISRNAA
ncbi:hypothetical protein MXL52_12935 [Staphylococcus gallinarum]|uniref:hypothetical protein n=1 Tax=Staphylococcus gallinarum TaxID=1293 RepID=UPI002DB8C318|nr:hypothetical protein [Staphylococcus gallinarum]MEB6238747.1 hypothetical protein [Staphylococcus gallinarum]